ncbi:hypothetical protein [Mitsuaria sp. 7]|uniref:hypothetical protein n=1 Tax=Mitsuaria sp. 7 TaxID=1658665 RepID=UPI0007DD44DC|nr:hypothetical protein [Mitsuaria sp. 7]ANH68647.1 hypothetical protein ABE85_15645 [Mitsuaria sp. 7]
MSLRIPAAAFLLLAASSCFAQAGDLSTLELREDERPGIIRATNDFECTTSRRRIVVQTYFERATQTARIDSVAYQGQPIADALLKQAQAETPRALPLGASLMCFKDHSDLLLFFRERADLPTTSVLIRLPAK